jgi:hypothetical protein
MGTGQGVLHGSSKFHQRMELDGPTFVSACRHSAGAVS